MSISSESIKSANNLIIGFNFHSLKRKYGRIRGTTYISFNKLYSREFIFNLNIYLIEDTTNVMNFYAFK